MHLLRSVDRNVKVFKRNASIRGSRLCILRWRREGHLILLKVEERSEPDVGQDEDGQKYLDESAQRVLLFVEPSYYMRTSSRAICRGRPSGKSRFNPRNLISRRVADYATWFEIGISFPLNPVTLFAHASDDWCGHGYGHGSIGVGTDYQDRAARLSLAKAISREILFNEFVVVPARS